MPVAVGHVFEKLLIEVGLILRGPPPAGKSHIVGMNIY
jgi:hypothetical protein